MIDEDLYKVATDELNSDARKPDVWARACALASDDHDEARFLYTNLRVEELLNTDGKQRTFSTTDQERETDLNHVDPSDTLELAEKDLKDLSDTETTDSPDISLENLAPVASKAAGIGNVHTPFPTDELDDYSVGDLNAPSSTSGASYPSDKAVEFDDETMAELNALSIENAKDNSSESSITGKRVENTQTPAGGTSTNDIVANVFGASAAATREKILSPQEQQTAELEHELERQARTMQDDEQLTASEVDAEVSPMVEDHDKTAEITEADVAYAAIPLPEYEEQSALVPDTEHNESSNILDDDGTLDIYSELDTGMGRSFMVFSQHGAMKAIKRGVSWPALFFTFPWLLSKALIGTALVYGFLWLVSLSGLLVTANSWLNAGAGASMNIKLWTGAFALLAIIGLLYIPFRYGNRWVAEKLQNRGYGYEASVNAANKLDAVDRLIRFNQENID